MDDSITLLRQALAFQIALQGPLVTMEPTDDPARAELFAPESAPPSPLPEAPPDQMIIMSPPVSSPPQSSTPYDRIEALIPTASPLRALRTLDEVRDYVANTILIPLDETRIKPVFGVGNPEADLMVIGEAPGADEDQQGEPFVGRAGQLLTKILDAIGFSRDQVYIANILKSRPPNNREPQADEVAAHIPILYKQIALIRPRLILCVGKTAGNNLLKKQASLAALRGDFNDFHGIPTMVTYHPAALLRNPEWKRPTWEDVQKLRDRYDELTAG